MPGCLISYPSFTLLLTETGGVRPNWTTSRKSSISSIEGLERTLRRVALLSGCRVPSHPVKKKVSCSMSSPPLFFSSRHYFARHSFFFPGSFFLTPARYLSPIRLSTFLLPSSFSSLLYTHHASHLFYAPVARSDRRADREPPAPIVFDQVQPMARKGRWHR